MNEKVALVIASEGYQPTEYGVPKQLLKESGFEVVTVSDKVGEVVAKDGSTTQATVDLKEFQASSVDGVFFIGGPGALKHLDNQETNRILNEAMIQDMHYGAICISPRILAKAHVLIGKRATGWNGDGELAQIFAENNVEYIAEGVVVDGNVITADGPESSEAFGQAIIALLKQ